MFNGDFSVYDMKHCSQTNVFSFLVRKENTHVLEAP